MKQVLLDLSQPQIDIEVTEPCEIFGLYIGKDAEQINTNLNIIHSQPKLQSLIIIKAVLFDQAQFSFTGNLIINQGAKHTDTYLKVSVLMMSKEAKAKAEPVLEIMEQEVKGGHGATVGKVDPEELFYLTSRGLTFAQANNLLVQGFLSDVITRINTADLRLKAKQMLAKLRDRIDILF